MANRCAWASNERLIAYHDREWGVPEHDDRRLFELLVLEGAQAGLSWDTILRKRDAYREAFQGFDPQKVARFTEDDIRTLLTNPGIVRNRLKVRSAVENAKRFLEIQREYGSFDEFLWRYVDGRPITNAWRAPEEVPVSTAVSDRMSNDLKRRGFSFVGSTICYSLMQAVGMVNDHLVDCFGYNEVHVNRDPS